MRSLVWALAAVSLACAGNRWHTVRASRPLSRAELGVRPLVFPDAARVADASLVECGAALREALVRAAAAEGFRVVYRSAIRDDPALTVRLERAADRLRAVATLASEDFFIDEAEAVRPPGEVCAAPGLDAVAAELTKSLAVSDGLSFFFRNSGTPAQTLFTN